MSDTSFDPQRRHALTVGASLLLPGAAWSQAYVPPAINHAALSALEKRVGGRLGVAMLHTGSGAVAGHRMRERFAMCSTFKLPLTAAILRQVDQGRLQLDQWVPFGAADMLSHAPVTSQHVARGGMVLHDLARAAQVESDNPAANLLLPMIGGTSGFTSLMRASNDAVTRLDRMEPHLNFVAGDDIRDTTTPQSMARTAALYLTQHWLSPASTRRLAGWMEDTTTGVKRLRAGWPADWRAGDKTGTAMADGMADKYNDVAVAWPKGRPPLVVTAYYEAPVSHGGKIRDEDQAVLAEVGRIAAYWYLQQV